MTPRMLTHMHAHTHTCTHTHMHAQYTIFHLMYMHAQYTIFHLMYCSLSVKYLNKPNGRFKYRMVSLVLLYHATYHIMCPVMSFDGRHLENPGMPEGSGSTWNNIWKESRRCKHIKSTGWKAAVQRSRSLHTGVELEDYTRFLTRGKGCGKKVLLAYLLHDMRFYARTNCTYSQCEYVFLNEWMKWYISVGTVKMLIETMAMH